MNNLHKKTYLSIIIIPLLIGICCLAIGAGVGISWTKSKVTPVVIVEPSYGGFKAIGRNSSVNKWTKAQVKPVLLVKPSLDSFVPYTSPTMGNKWGKNDVTPIMLVEPKSSQFIPMRAMTSANIFTGVGTSQTLLKTPDVIESKVDGEFNGWDGETIVKLANGQIWQQAEYTYRYRYRYRPDVLIYKSGSSYKMMVEGVDKAVRVKRLK